MTILLWLVVDARSEKPQCIRGEMRFHCSKAGYMTWDKKLGHKHSIFNAGQLDIVRLVV